MRPHAFRVIIEPEKPKGYHGFAPLLRGVHTYGNTIEEVQKNLREAITCHLQGLAKDGEVIPQEEEALELVQSFSGVELAAKLRSAHAQTSRHQDKGTYPGA